MSRVNLYAHYDSVTNYMMTRGINLLSIDFDVPYFPDNIILAEAPEEFGRYDAQTNFKIIRGKTEIQQYMQQCEKNNLRMSNWIDFESVELMHQLTPNEIAELLYLFHSSMVLRSAFYYKLQNNYVYLTLPNGLNKTYYRHISHFIPRFQRVMTEKMDQLVNEGKSFFLSKKEQVSALPTTIVEQMGQLFASGLKIDFVQADKKSNDWVLPLFIIEDELTLLSQNRPINQAVGTLEYNVLAKKWQLNLKK